MLLLTGGIMRWVSLCVLAFALSATPLRAQNTQDGSYLLVSCQITIRVFENPDVALNKYEEWRDGFCRGIVEGVSDTSSLVCQEEGVVFGQEVRIVVKYLQDHPEQLHLKNTKLVEMALAKAFPCSK
jgi:hypothetical protein